MRFKIDWASLINRRKFTVFALFYFVFVGNFQVQTPRGAYIWRGDLTEGFLRYEFGGHIFGGAYTWRGLFSEFYGILCKSLGEFPLMHSLINSSKVCFLFQVLLSKVLFITGGTS